MTFKVYTDGTPLAAADLNAIMAQIIPTFADPTGRDAAITAPIRGQFCYILGVGLQLFDATSKWRTVATELPTPPAPGAASTFNRYAAPGTSQSIPSNTWTRVLLSSPITTTADWTVATVGPGSVFTCKTPGRYGISTYFRYGTFPSGGSRGLAIADTNQQTNAVASSWFAQTTTDPWADTIYGERTFALNDTFSIWAYTGSYANTPSADILLPFVNIRQIL